MKKVFVILATLFLFVPTILFGQTSVSLEIFPDVEITSVDGLVHRPYDHLNAGKTVIFDFFSTSCAPCWEYHENEVLQSIYETYGPTGSDQVVIYMVEGNLNSNMDDLAGTGINTFGNYLDCSPYPVFDDHEFAFEMGIHEDPTLLFVCPDKKVTEIGQLSETELADLIEYGCPNQYYHNNLELLYFTCNLDPTCGESDFIPTVMVQNNGSNTIEHVSLQMSENGEILEDSVGFDLFIEQFETTVIPFEFGEISATASIEIELLSVNHAPDTVLDRNSIEGIKHVLAAEDEKISVRITTDQFGYEIFWEILDENGYQVASGGNELVIAGGQQDAYYLLESPNYYSASTIFDIPVTLPSDGCYTFKIYDDWGDGICCEYGTGKFEIFKESGELLLDNINFLKEHSIDFLKSDLSVSVTNDLAISKEPFLFPNPTRNSTSLNFYSASNNVISFHVYDNLGRLITKQEKEVLIGENLLEFDFTNLSSGNYFLVGDQEVLKYRLPFQIFRD